MGHALSHIFSCESNIEHYLLCLAGLVSALSEGVHCVIADQLGVANVASLIVFPAIQQ